MRLLFLLWMLFHLVGCNTSKKIQQVQKPREQSTQSLRLERGSGENKILFLTMGLWLQDSIKDEYGFIKKAELYAPGSVKAITGFEGPYEPYQLYWQTKDAKNETMETGKVPDPLYQSFETSDPNTGRMEKHLVSSQSGEIVLRFNLNDKTRSVSIHKLSDGKLKKLYEATIL
jgi:hypothetical protein